MWKTKILKLLGDPIRESLGGYKVEFHKQDKMYKP